MTYDPEQQRRAEMRRADRMGRRASPGIIAAAVIALVVAVGLVAWALSGRHEQSASSVPSATTGQNTTRITPGQKNEPNPTPPQQPPAKQ